MRKCYCDYRYLLLIAALPFIYIQMRLFATQSQFADRLADAIEAENQCTKQTRILIDQISMQQEQILSLEEERKRQDEECRQLRALVQDLERKGLKKLVGDVQVPVAAVVVMACNRADYLDRTIKSILKYQSSVASRYPLFVSQDGSDPHVKSKALSYDQLTYMQDKYAEHFANLLKKATPVHGTDVVLKTYNIDGDVRILYRDQSDFEYIASQFGIFEEWKDGVPRTAYKGVVVFRYQTQRRVFLVGPDSLQQLGIR
ncbi:UNVERIFIED_CONTAM: Alpha-1,3-mannosyl-glycoprotein 2-beta-N-acetylglucosaminyltransferase [Sesamum indicum]